MKFSSENENTAQDRHPCGKISYEKLTSSYDGIIRIRLKGLAQAISATRAPLNEYSVWFV